MLHNDDDFLLDPIRRFLAEQASVATLRGALRNNKPCARGASKAAQEQVMLPHAPVPDDGSCDSRIHATLWSQICELGWPTLLVSEAHGGIGLGMAQAARVMELAGRALLPLPLDQWMTTAAFLSELDTQSCTYQWLERAMRDGRLVAFAMRAPGDRLFVPYCFDDNEILMLQYADDTLLARVADGIPGAPGIDPLIPGGWLQAPAWKTQDNLACDGMAWTRFELRSRVLLAAQLLGVAARALELASAYAQERQQFGRLIGSFQAIKHRLAQDWMSLDNARLVVLEVASDMDMVDPSKTDARDISLMVALAEYTVQQAANVVVRNALQVHGAMGMTWECDVHFYLKRVHFLCAIMNRSRTAADRLQTIWKLSEDRMAVY
ncbi:MAG: acyl-CoA dehydrogenase family protein [Advenella sp.]